MKYDETVLEREGGREREKESDQVSRSNYQCFTIMQEQMQETATNKSKPWATVTGKGDLRDLLPNHNVGALFGHSNVRKQNNEKI